MKNQPQIEQEKCFVNPQVQSIYSIQYTSVYSNVTKFVFPVPFHEEGFRNRKEIVKVEIRSF